MGPAKKVSSILFFFVIVSIKRVRETNQIQLIFIEIILEPKAEIFRGLVDENGWEYLNSNEETIEDTGSEVASISMW